MIEVLLRRSMLIWWRLEPQELSPGTRAAQTSPAKTPRLSVMKAGFVSLAACLEWVDEPQKVAGAPETFPLTAEAVSTNLTKLAVRHRHDAPKRVPPRGISSSAAFVGFKRVAPAMPPSLSPLMMAQEPAYGLKPLSEATLKQCREEIEPI